MKHAGTQTLETGRLIPRKYRLSDADAMFRNWASDSEVTKYLTWPAHSGVEVSKLIPEARVQDYEKPDSYRWAITVKENGDEPVGDIAVVSMNEGAEAAHIGYCIGRNRWHQGIAPEALKAVIAFLFDTVGVNRVEARHDANNPNPGKVMQKCGMQYEGTLRQSDRNNQGICDACYYGLLKGER